MPRDWRNKDEALLSLPGFEDQVPVVFSKDGTMRHLGTQDVVCDSERTPLPPPPLDVSALTKTNPRAHFITRTAKKGALKRRLGDEDGPDSESEQEAGAVHAPAECKWLSFAPATRFLTSSRCPSTPEART